ncbi:unnamed protein product, partial [Prorocentrum cordatum]
PSVQGRPPGERPVGEHGGQEAALRPRPRLPVHPSPGRRAGPPRGVRADGGGPRGRCSPTRFRKSYGGRGRASDNGWHCGTPPAAARPGHQRCGGPQKEARDLTRQGREPCGDPRRPVGGRGGEHQLHGDARREARDHVRDDGAEDSGRGRVRDEDPGVHQGNPLGEPHPENHSLFAHADVQE